MEQKRLSKITLLAYASGDFASNLCWTFTGSYLTVFYTDVVGIAPAVAATLMLIARIWGGVCDPLFGVLGEHTRSKRGRFRPYIFFGTPVLAVFSVLVFTTVGSGDGAIVWAYITYILCGTAYTAVNLSYGSLSTVMTTNREDIVQLNGWRMMGMNISSVLLNAITPPLLILFSGGTDQFTAQSYTMLAIIFACCATPLFYFVYAQCKETVQPSKTVKVTVGDSIKTVLTNVPLMLIFLIQLTTMTAIFGRIGTVLYYLMYNVGDPGLMSVFMTLPAIFTVIGIAVTTNFVIRVGKKIMIAIGSIGCGGSLLAMYFVGWDNIPLLLILTASFGFFSFSGPIIMSMVPDAINYMEDKTGIRADGTSYAVSSLASKLGSAIGVFIGLLIMGATGYVAGTTQSPEALDGINLTVNLVFGGMVIATVIPLVFYPLNEKRNAEISERLNARRAAEEGISVEAAAEELREIDEVDAVMAEAAQGEASSVFPEQPIPPDHPRES